MQHEDESQDRAVDGIAVGYCTVRVTIVKRILCFVYVITSLPGGGVISRAPCLAVTAHRLPVASRLAYLSVTAGIVSYLTSFLAASLRRLSRS